MAATVLLLTRGAPEKTLVGPRGDAIGVRYPDEWRSLTREQLDALPTAALAVLVRKDGKGVVSIRRDKAAPRISATFVRDLERELKGRVPDYRGISAKILTIPAGEVFFFSYVRKRKGTLHTVVIVPSGDHSYVVDTVSDPGSKAASEEIGDMIRSFTPPSV